MRATQCKNLSDILLEKSLLINKGITFIESGSHEHFVSYQDLYKHALCALFYLQQNGIKPGDELVLQVEDNNAFLTIFWACILGGIIPIPLTIGQNDEHKQKLFNVWNVLSCPFLAIESDDLEKVKQYAAKQQQEDSFEVMVQRSLLTSDILAGHTPGEIFSSQEDDLAFIQFSSGSTGKPKGVMLTHGNLIANINAISAAAAYTANDATLSWMPLTHDMGLIGFHLNPLCVGMQQYLMPTNTFVRRPALWMDKATTHRITVLCSPNFGYEYLLKHASVSEHWDLTAVRILFNGAEPISSHLYENFIRQLARVGLNAGAVRPVYGLAEASLAVTISEIDTVPETLAIDSRYIGKGERVRIKQSLEEYTSTQVNVGRSIPDCFIRIASEDNIQVPELVVYEIQISGRNVTKGYYNNAAATEKLITPDGWLKTGDLGFMYNGNLYVTGRAKDILFINGKNYYSQDIERAALEVEGISLNKIVVAGYFNYQTQREETVAFVFHRGSLTSFLPLAAALKRHVNSSLGIVFDRIIPVQHIPRTTSGKLQRFRLMEQLLQGDFDATGKELAALLDDDAQLAGPHTATEARLLDIWKEVLQQERIGIHDNFFEVGGNSLRAIEAAMKISRAFEKSLPLQILFERKTIAALAPIVESGIESPVASIPTVVDTRNFAPVAPVQKTLYYNWERDKTDIAYNIPVAFDIKGDIDTTRLQECFQQLLQRHDVFRMSFHLEDQPVMQVHKDVGFVLSEISCEPADLPSLVQPFDLHQAPLCRAHLITTATSQKILFLDIHHIISDGISVSLLIEELFDLYAGNTLVPVSTSYQDYTAWRHATSYIVQRDYWQQKLAGPLPVLNLPADYQRPVVFSPKGEKLAFGLKPSTVYGLRQLAQKADCTLQVLLFFIYKILLQKYTQQQDIIIGIPVAGRNHLDLLPLQGMFVNNLCIRNPLDTEDIFMHGLKKEQEQLLEALACQELPFGEVLQLLDTARDPGRHPVFDTMFVYQNMPQPRISYGDVSIRMHTFDPGISKFDLTLEIFEDAETIRYHLEYATSIFSRDTILTFSRHLEALLESVITAPFCKIADLRLAQGEECPSGSHETYPHDKTVDEIFTRQAAATPLAIAVEYNGHCYTYKDLDLRSNAVAYRLQQEGIGKGEMIALIFQRSPELIIAILGVLKAGAAYVPIDPELPSERISFILRDSAARLVLTTANLQQQNHYPTGVKILADIYEAKVTTQPASAHTAEDLAYVIYTSGTTGQPKGAMISHRSLHNYTAWAIRNYLKEVPASMPLYTAISFDLTITAIFPPLLSGNKIVVYEEQPGAFVLERILKENKVAVVKITPSHLRLLRDSQLKGLIGEDCIIKAFVIGGESLETWLARDVYELFSGKVALYNEYGPTETTVGCMIHQFDPKENWLSVPIGIPAANTNIYLLDAALNKVPAGLTGEIYISGDGVGKGYLYNEALTAQRFVCDPFTPGKRMYKTGDLARMLPDGKLLFLGRADRQVKLNGYRIELAEIEQQLLNYPGILEVVMDITQIGAQQQTLVAYFRTANNDDAISSIQLKNYLAARLPYYMIPAYFHQVAVIPLTVNGKVDTARLVLPTAEPTEKQAPATAMAARMLDIWRTLLGSPELEVTDNFFAFGGDSVKAIQIVSKLAALNVHITVKDILTYHTVEQICMHLPADQIMPVYEQGSVAGEKALTPIERWFFANKFQHPEYYHQSVLLELQQPLQVQQVQQAFEKLIGHHDGLRLNYNSANKKLFYNARHLEQPFIINVITADATQLPEIAEALRSGLDLEHSLLFRAALLHLTDGRNLLFITAHHLIVDGVTWRILLEDLYSLLKDDSQTLPLKTASLLDWEKHLPTGSEKVSDLPIDNKLADCYIADSSHYTIKIAANVTAAFSQYAWQVYKADTAALLCAATIKALAEGTGQQSLIIEQEHHGRDLTAIDVSRTTGWFTRMYPVAVNDTGLEMPSLIGIIRAAAKTGDNTQPLNAPADLRFNYLGDFTRDLHNDLFSYSTLATGKEIHGSNHMTARLELNAMIIQGALTIDLIYHKNIFPEATIKGWMTLLEQRIQLLAVSVADKDKTLMPSDFDCVDLTQEELDILF
ncbi:amino acid adenylation domain-containing protein [Chitinophaga sp. Hz27]|uniref:amino acid adenylation domain-containing protein n=1 Tax=Chitinophaga sp. Hz27 TaxID=3347169 RepID=UPI0035DB1AC8